MLDFLRGVNGPFFTWNCNSLDLCLNGCPRLVYFHFLDHCDFRAYFLCTFSIHRVLGAFRYQ